MIGPDAEALLEDLLEYIEESSVIPIIGEDLLVLNHNGHEITLHNYIAHQLAERLGVSAALPVDPCLDDVISAHFQTGSPREDVYAKIPPIVRSAAFAPPEALLNLASIDKFKLYITLTFDSLLVTAIDQTRGLAGGERTLDLAYSPNAAVDLPDTLTKLRRPVVYHLLGKLSAQPGEYVVTEEDMLEFLHHMQRRTTADLLFDTLRDSHLLFIGCTLSDWLVRFLLRIMRRQPLSQRRPFFEALVGEFKHEFDRGLLAFLNQFSTRTKIVSCPPRQFVAELAARYRQRAGQETGAVGPLVEMEEGAVFLSYAHEDYTAARRLRDFLDEEGIDVWFNQFNQETIQGGEYWGDQIRRNINNCSYFMPVISATATRVREGYFRREWNLAAERASRFSEHVLFIIPVVVDDTPTDTRGVPERFRQVQWTRLPAGEATRDFGNHMISLVRDFRRKGRGRLR